MNKSINTYGIFIPSDKKVTPALSLFIGFCNKYIHMSNSNSYFCTWFVYALE